MRATVIAASNRAAAGVYEDTTGPLIVAALEELGFEVTGPVVVPDGEPVGEAIREAVQGGARAVLTTGGTGLTPTDLTPEVTRPLLDREVPGVAEAIRAYGVAHGVSQAALRRRTSCHARASLMRNGRSPTRPACSSTRHGLVSGRSPRSAPPRAAAAGRRPRDRPSRHRASPGG